MRLAVLLTLAFPTAGRAADAETGSFAFRPSADGVLPRYVVPPRDVPFTLTPKFDLRQSNVRVYTLTFPSPLPGDIPENNTVHAEYFLPIGVTDRRPAVVVFDILDGAGVISRGEALWLAQQGVPSLFMYMAHYGPRRPAGSKVRLLSTNVDHTVAAVRQTVLDARCALAWLATRPEVDADRLGVVGTSLGSFVAAVVAGNEPRVATACLVLGGGALVDSYADHPLARPYMAVLDLLGGTTALKAQIAPVDPITFADTLRTKRLLLIAARRDDVVPPKAMTALWAAAGRPELVWLEASHVGAALHSFRIMNAVVRHVKGK